MAATSRPTLTVYSISDIADAAAICTTDTLSNINTVSAVRAPSQHINLPQRAVYFEIQFEGIGANFQWEVSEFFLGVKDRALR